MIQVRVAITAELATLLREYRVLTARDGERWQEGAVIALDPTARIEKYSHVLQGQTLPLAMGAFSYSHSVFSTDMEIGRYCSLSFGVEMILGNHPMDWATTSPVTHQPIDIPGLRAYLRDRGERAYGLHGFGHPRNPAILGHDVWVGMRVLIKRGVKVGHGAVIAAGSVVTRDVPPYAIVGGTPAKVIRYRFPEPIIERLLRSEWWNYGPEKLQPLDMREPEAFLDALEAAVSAGLRPLTLPVLTGKEIIAAGKQLSS